MTMPEPRLSFNLWIRTGPGELLRADQVARMQVRDTSGNTLQHPDDDYDENAGLQLRVQLLGGSDWIVVAQFPSAITAFNAMESLVHCLFQESAQPQFLTVDTARHPRQRRWTITQAP